MPKPIVEVDNPVSQGDRHILVCQNTSCLAQQGAEVAAKFAEENLPDGVTVSPVGCQGQCSIAATVRIVPDETWYHRVTPEDVPEICEALRNDTVVTKKLNPRIHRSY